MASAPPPAPADAGRPAPAPSAVEDAAPPLATLAGRITLGGESAPDAELVVISADAFEACARDLSGDASCLGWLRGGSPSARSDAAGVFAVCDLAPGHYIHRDRRPRRSCRRARRERRRPGARDNGVPYELRIDSGTHVPFRAELRVAQDMAPVAVSLDTGISLAGRVVDATGAPVAEAWIEAAAGGERRRARSGPDGEYALSGLAAGEAEVRVTHPAHVVLVMRVQLPPGPGAGDMALARGARAEIQVDELPGSGSRLELEDVQGARLRGSVDAPGRFVVESLLPGDYRVWLRAEGYLPFDAGLVSIAPGDGQTHRVRFAGSLRPASGGGR